MFHLPEGGSKCNRLPAYKWGQVFIFSSKYTASYKTTWHETISKPSRTYGDYWTKSTASAFPAPCLNPNPNHLANKPLQTTSTLFGIMYPTTTHWAQRTINIFTATINICFIHFRKSHDRKRLPFFRSSERSECQSGKWFTKNDQSLIQMCPHQMNS